MAGNGCTGTARDIITVGKGCTASGNHVINTVGMIGGSGDRVTGGSRCAVTPVTGSLIMFCMSVRLGVAVIIGRRAVVTGITG